MTFIYKSNYKSVYQLKEKKNSFWIHFCNFTSSGLVLQLQTESVTKKKGAKIQTTKFKVVKRHICLAMAPYNLFLQYGWNLQNPGKEAILTKLHTTVKIPL